MKTKTKQLKRRNNKTRKYKKVIGGEDNIILNKEKIDDIVDVKCEKRMQINKYYKCFNNKSIIKQLFILLILNSNFDSPLIGLFREKTEQLKHIQERLLIELDITKEDLKNKTKNAFENLIENTKNAMNTTIGIGNKDNMIRYVINSHIFNITLEFNKTGEHTIFNLHENILNKQANTIMDNSSKKAYSKNKLRVDRLIYTKLFDSKLTENYVTKLVDIASEFNNFELANILIKYGATYHQDKISSLNIKTELKTKNRINLPWGVTKKFSLTRRLLCLLDSGAWSKLFLSKGATDALSELKKPTKAKLTDSIHWILRNLRGIKYENAEVGRQPALIMYAFMTGASVVGFMWTPFLLWWQNTVRVANVHLDVYYQLNNCYGRYQVDTKIHQESLNDLLDANYSNDRNKKDEAQDRLNIIMQKNRQYETFVKSTITKDLTCNLALDIMGYIRALPGLDSRDAKCGNDLKLSRDLFKQQFKSFLFHTSGIFVSQPYKTLKFGYNLLHICVLALRPDLVNIMKCNLSQSEFDTLKNDPCYWIPVPVYMESWNHRVFSQSKKEYTDKEKEYTDKEKQYTEKEEEYFKATGMKITHKEITKSLPSPYNEENNQPLQLKKDIQTVLQKDNKKRITLCDVIKKDDYTHLRYLLQGNPVSSFRYGDETFKGLSCTDMVEKMYILNATGDKELIKILCEQLDVDWESLDSQEKNITPNQQTAKYCISQNTSFKNMQNNAK